MKRFLYYVLILCSTFTVTTVQGSESLTPNGARIIVPEADFEFRKVIEGAKVTHDFVIKNDGDEVLKIQKVKST